MNATPDLGRPQWEGRLTFNSGRHMQTFPTIAGRIEAGFNGGNRRKFGYPVESTPPGPQPYTISLKQIDPHTREFVEVIGTFTIKGEGS